MIAGKSCKYSINGPLFTNDPYVSFDFLKFKLTLIEIIQRTEGTILFLCKEVEEKMTNIFISNERLISFTLLIRRL